MAYLDTKNLTEAKTKALKLGCTHFFHYILESNEIFSTYFVKGDQPDSDGMLKEIASYSHNMQSFDHFERDQPENNIGDPRTGYTKLYKLEALPPENKLPQFNACK